MPVPAVLGIVVKGGPDDEVGLRGTDLLVATRAPVRFCGAQRRHRTDDVLLTPPLLACLANSRQWSGGAGRRSGTATILARHGIQPKAPLSLTPLSRVLFSRAAAPSTQA